MSEFKIGDKIRVTMLDEMDEGFVPQMKIGDIGNITSIVNDNDDGIILDVKFNGYIAYLWNYQVELVDETPKVEVSEDVQVIRDFYEQLVASGFSESQALDVMKTSIMASVGGNK